MFQSQALHLNNKILHVAPDEKFIDAAFFSFEMIAPGKNHFLVVTISSEKKYIKEANVELITPKEFFRKSALTSFSGYEFIVLHSLNYTYVKMLSKLQKRNPIVWIGWGFDYYDLISGSRKNLFLPETKKLAEKLEKQDIIIFLKYQIKKLFLDAYRIEKKIRILRHVDFFSPVIYEDYALVKNSYKNRTPRYIPWNYPSSKVNSLKGDLYGNNILVGNSATPANNHLDVFTLLKKMDLSGRKIICPLSYGDVRYKEHILKAGYELFYDKFFPLLEFFPMEEYVRILQSCSIGVMNHLRQQGAGNVNLLLMNGSKCFMQESNPLYINRKKMGVKIYPMAELTPSNPNVFNGLAREDILINRNIIMEHRSLDVALAKTYNLIETVMNYKLQGNMGKT